MKAAVRRRDFDYTVHSLKVLTPDANAMLLAMIDVEAAELGDAKAAEYWLQRQQGGFLKPPFDVRSETVTNNTTHILATSAGFLQDFLFGFSGLRITETGLEQRYGPILPESVGSLELRNIKFRGDRTDYLITRGRDGTTTLTRRRPRRIAGSAHGL